MSKLACPAAFTCPAAIGDQQRFGTSGYQQPSPRRGRSLVKCQTPRDDSQRFAASAANGAGSPDVSAARHLASPPLVTYDVPPRTATAKPSARSAAAKNPPPPASAKDAPAPATENVSPSPGIGTLSPSQTPAANYDGFTVGIDDGEEAGQPLSIRPRPTKQSKVRQKPDTTEGPSAIQSLDDSEVEKLKPKLTICRGC